MKPAKKVMPISRKGVRADNIYSVAARIMCEKGYEATSMNDIAEAAGLTKAGVYHYIRGKEQLLFEIMNYAMDVVDEQVIAPTRSISDPENRLRKIIELHARTILEGVGAVTIILEELSSLTPAHRRAIRARQRSYFEYLRQTLEQVNADGKLLPVDATVAAFSLLGIILWIPRWYRRDGKLKLERALADYCEIATNAVLRNDGSRSLAPVALRRAAD